MSKTKWYFRRHCERSVAILLALALVLSLGITALPMAGMVGAESEYTIQVNDRGQCWAPSGEDTRYISALGKGTAADPFVVWYEDRNDTSNNYVKRAQSTSNENNFPANGTGISFSSVSNDGTYGHPFTFKLFGEDRLGMYLWESTTNQGRNFYVSFSTDGLTGLAWTDPVCLSIHNAADFPSPSYDNPDSPDSPDFNNNNNYGGYGIVDIKEIDGTIYLWWAAEWKDGICVTFSRPGKTGDDRYQYFGNEVESGVDGEEILSKGAMGGTSKPDLAATGGVVKLSDNTYRMFFKNGEDVKLGLARTLDGITDWSVERSESNPILDSPNNAVIPNRANIKEVAVVETNTPGMFGLLYTASFSSKHVGYATVIFTPPPSEAWVAPPPTGDDANPGTEAEPFATIQKGIDTVAEGGTVHVAAGTYNEHLIIHTPNINLIGEDRESTIIDAMQDPSWSSAKAGILIEGSNTGQSGASNVTISGFTIRNAELEGDGILFHGLWECLGGASGIQIYGSSGNTIENNIIEKCGYQIWILAEWAEAGYDNSENNTISQNIIRDSAQRAIYLYSDNSVYVSNTTISDNAISDTRDEFGTSAGIYMWGEVTDTLIENNTITNCNDGIRTWNEPWFYSNSLMNHTSIIGNNITHSRQCGILLQNGSYNTVRDNILEYNGGGGIQIHYDSSSIITGNTIRENPKGGILLTACENTTVTGNNIFDNNGIREIGIIVHSIYGISTGLVVNNNNIYGHTEYGMQVMDGAVSSPVDATNNWWGANDGPDDDDGVINGSGDKVSTNVDADPWLVIAVSADPTSIVANGTSTSTITADMTKNSDDETTSGVPDGTEIIFTTNKGSIGSLTATKTTTSGVATAILTSSTSIETATVCAKAPGHETESKVCATVEFTPGATATVAIVANPINVPADGTSTSTLTATVNDEYGNPVADGTNVIFETDHGILGSSTVTKQTTSGVATATLTSESSTETVIATIIATANGASDATAVFFIPAGGAEVEESKTEIVTGSGTIDETDTVTGMGDIDIDATGDHTITTAEYEDNPGGTPTFEATGDYYDVHLDDDTGVDSLTIEFCPAAEGTVIYYWDGASWRRCSEQSYSDGCIVVTITADTFPSLSNLSGLPFGSGTPPPPAPVGGEAYPVNKLAILAPWITVGMAIIAGSFIVMRRRRAQS